MVCDPGCRLERVQESDRDVSILAMRVLAISGN